MTTVRNIRGESGEFDPEDPLREDEMNASAFGRPAAEEEHEDPPGAPTAPSSKLPRLLLIAAGVVVAGGVVWMTIAPALKSSPQAQSMRAAPVSTMTPSGHALSMPSTLPATQPAGSGALNATQDMRGSPLSAAQAVAAAPAPTPTVPMAQVPQPSLLAQQPLSAAAGPGSSFSAGPIKSEASGETGSVPSASPEATTQPPAQAPVEATAATQKALSDRLDRLEAQVASLSGAVKALADAEHKAAEPKATTPVRTVARSAKREQRHTPEHKEERRAPSASKVASPAAHRTAHGQDTPKLKAVLVGQAWFQLRSGQTITVGLGDDVPGYGRVQAINADTGEVRFANGDIAK